MLTHRDAGDLYMLALETMPLLLRLCIEASCAWRAANLLSRLLGCGGEPIVPCKTYMLLWRNHIVVGMWLQSRMCAYGVDCPDVGERGAKAGCVRPWRSSVARGAGGKTFVMKLSFSEKRSGFW